MRVEGLGGGFGAPKRKIRKEKDKGVSVKLKIKAPSTPAAEKLMGRLKIGIPAGRGR